MITLVFSIIILKYWWAILLVIALIGFIWGMIDG